MIEPAFRILLLTDTATKAQVGDRVFFGLKPQNERRASIILTLVSHLHYHHMQGKAGYATGRMQIDCQAPTYPEVKVLAAAALAALDNYTGTVDATEIDYIECDDESDTPVSPLEGKALPTFGVTFDARFQHSE